MVAGSGTVVVCKGRDIVSQCYIPHITFIIIIIIIIIIISGSSIYYTFLNIAFYESSCGSSSNSSSAGSSCSSMTYHPNWIDGSSMFSIRQQENKRFKNYA